MHRCIILIFVLLSGHHRLLRQADCMYSVISQGEAKQERTGLFEPKASFQGAAERALEISQIHAHAGSNAGDVYKKLQRLATKIHKNEIFRMGRRKSMKAHIAARPGCIAHLRKLKNCGFNSSSAGDSRGRRDDWSVICCFGQFAASLPCFLLRNKQR